MGSQAKEDSEENPLLAAETVKEGLFRCATRARFHFSKHSAFTFFFFFLQLAVHVFLLQLYCEPRENDMSHYSSFHPQDQQKAHRPTCGISLLRRPHL